MTAPTQRDPRVAEGGGKPRLSSEPVRQPLLLDTIGGVTAGVRIGKTWYVYRPVERIEITTYRAEL